MCLKRSFPSLTEANLPDPWSSSPSRRFLRHHRDRFPHRCSNLRAFRLCLASRSPRPPCFSPQRVVSSALRRCGNEFGLKPQCLMEVCVYDQKRQGLAKNTTWEFLSRIDSHWNKIKPFFWVFIWLKIKQFYTFTFVSGWKTFCNFILMLGDLQ